MVYAVLSVYLLALVVLGGQTVALRLQPGSFSGLEVFPLLLLGFPCSVLGLLLSSLTEDGSTAALLVLVACCVAQPLLLGGAFFAATRWWERER